MAKKNYDMEWSTSSKKKSDCDIILNDVENVFGSIGSCMDTVFDEKKSKMQVVSGIFGILGSTTKLVLRGTGCAIKHTPKAIATVASAKRELTNTITEEYHRYQIEQKEQDLDNKIVQLKYKSNTKLLK